jgi:hypothetical protein
MANCSQSLADCGAPYFGGIAVGAVSHATVFQIGARTLRWMIEKQIAVLWTQHACSRVEGNTRGSAAQNPNAPSATASAGATIPRVLRLRSRSSHEAVPSVGDRDQFFAPIGPYAHDYEQTQPVLGAVGVGQPHVDIHPVGPDIDVVHPRQIPTRPVGMLALPRHGEPVDRRGRQPGVGAEEPR